jgi:hypothetical protein
MDGPSFAGALEDLDVDVEVFVDGISVERIISKPFMLIFYYTYVHML